MFNISEPVSSSLKSPLKPDFTRSVSTSLNFGASRPGVTDKWYFEVNKQDGRNFDVVSFPMTVYDIRGQESLTHIDVTGFQMLTSPSSVSGDFILTAPEDETNFEGLSQIIYKPIYAMV